MLRNKETELQARRAQLTERSQALRVRLSGQAQVLQRPLALADGARRGIAWLRSHPQWLLGLFTPALLLRPRRALRWSLKLWWAWRLWRRLQAVLPPRGSQPP